MNETENKETMPTQETTETPAVNQETAPSKMKAWREYKKEKRKAKRTALEAEYANAPAFIRVFRLKILKPLIWVLVILAIVGILYGAGYYAYSIGALDWIEDLASEECENTEVTQEQIYAKAPLDEEGQKTIDALSTYPADDTWTICIYMIGANLESSEENDLSELVDYETSPINQENWAEVIAKDRSNIEKFISEIGEKGMYLPDYFYIPTNPVASVTTDTTEVIVSDEEGCGSMDLDEMMAADFGDNIKIVVQTGGAKRWSNVLINPNKTQRFEVSSGRMDEIESMPLQDMGSVDTLTDFLTFCKEEYPADHQILILWDHGNGAFGYGSDEIFCSSFSIGDLKEAFTRVYGENPETTPYEVIGFDACLMSSLEVCHELSGYGKYLAASEELEPMYGWDYTTWINDLASDGTTNGAKIAQEIADAFMDFYVKDNIRNEGICPEIACEFSVVDIAKAEESYQAYCNLMKTALVAAIKDQGILADLGSAGQKTIRYGASDYDVYNTVDLGTFVDELIEQFPEDSSAVKDALNEAVVYHRQNGYISDSQGLSIYFPVEVSTLTGLAYYLDYVYDITEDDSVKALYYYKLGGCLNEELTEYVKTLGCDEVPVLDLAPLLALQYVEVSIKDGNYSLAVTPETQSLIQGYAMTLALLDDENDCITYFGNDNYAYFDGDGNLATAFEGQWVSMNGQMLSLEVADEAPSNIHYRTRVLWNDVESYLLINFDRDTEEFSIMGIHHIPDSYDDAIADVSDRNLQALQVGDTLVPLYYATDNESSKTIDLQGDKITYNDETVIEMEPIEDGSYLTYIVVTDCRSDEYYTQVVQFTYDENAGVQDMQINDDYAIVKTE